MSTTNKNTTPKKPEELGDIIEITRDGSCLRITAKLNLMQYRKILWYQRGYRGRREGPAVFLCNMDPTDKIKTCVIAGTSVTLDKSFIDYFNDYYKNKSSVIVGVS